MLHSSQERAQVHCERWSNLYNEQIKNRLEKRQRFEELGLNPYRNDFSPNICLEKLKKTYNHKSKEELEEDTQKSQKTYSIAGRVMFLRSFGKAAFFTLDDGYEKLQLYVRKGDIPDEQFQEYKLAEYGDIVYAQGFIFKTNKGELSLHAKTFHILTKSIRPLPEKFHGLTDNELRYRMRYVDTTMNPKVRETFKIRSKITHHLREFFHDYDFIEVETPMLHSVVGGALAKPFKTHHNSLNMDMTLRIAPELDLKRLLVGGFPRVFEVNRCFRNEGLSIKHNPEFTTVEFYWAYTTYHHLMDFTEKLLCSLVEKICNSSKIAYEDKELSFERPFKRMTLKNAISLYSSLNDGDLMDPTAMTETLLSYNPSLDRVEIQKLSIYKLQELCFEEFAEKNLVQPTFITEYPTEISPLSRESDENPNYVDRFELFINGWEMANGFNELNNPTEQLKRFAHQAVAKEMGNDEACDVDYDYVRALEYGMPPAAGEGIGIDRLCMILTNSPSIRDVILFPLLKKEQFFN